MKRREMEALSVEECRRFLAVARESELFALLALALTTGMRPSEYLALKWSDIYWQRGAASVCRTIQHSKAGWVFDDTKRKRSRRVVKLQEFVLKALTGLRNRREPVAPDAGCSVEHDLIFRSSTGSPLRQRNVKREFRRLLEVAATRAHQLPIGALAAHPQLQRLSFLVDLALEYPVTRPSQYLRPVAVSQTA